MAGILYRTCQTKSNSYSRTWVIVSWGFPNHTAGWILDKGAWLQNMTKQGIIVNKIDDTTTLAVHPALSISFIDNNVKNSMIITQIGKMVLGFVYLADINDYSTNEDEANTMLSTFHINSWTPTDQDSRRIDNGLSEWGLK